MKEVAWIFGISASGKETFIDFVTKSKDRQLLGRLGWDNKIIKASPSSINKIGQYDDDPITLKRDQILVEVPKLLENSDIVLIKWQKVDSNSQRIEKLKSILPDAHHRIIIITTSHEEVAKRLPNKSWWNDEDVDDLINEDIEDLSEMLDSVSHELPITEISGNAGDGYRLI